MTFAAAQRGRVSNARGGEAKKMIAFAVAILVLMASFGQAAATPANPLDPLSHQELLSAVAVLKNAGHVDDNSRFVFLTLREPDKTAVLKWKAGQPTSREAFVIIKQGSQTFEAIVNLTTNEIKSWREIKGVQPALLIDEIDKLNGILRADAGWQAAMRKRGFQQFDKIECMPFSAGYFGNSAEQGHRLVRAECYDAGSALNYWGRPIEGLVATVDLNQRQILKLVDTGVGLFRRSRRITTQSHLRVGGSPSIQSSSRNPTDPILPSTAPP
jgi:primary-amine oxidase